MRESLFIFLLYLILTLTLQCSSATDVVVTTINTNTFWSVAGSPYIIQNSLTVTGNLTIEAGVTVISIATGATAITVSGSGEIYCMGTPTNPITFNFTAIPASSTGLLLSGITRIPSYSNGPGSPSTLFFNYGSGSTIRNTIFINGNNQVTVTNSIVHFDNIRFIDWGLTALSITFPLSGGPTFTLALENIFISTPRLSSTTLDNFPLKIDASNSIAKLNIINATIQAGGLSVKNFAATSTVNLIQGSITGHKASESRVSTPKTCLSVDASDINYSLALRTMTINCEDTAAILSCAHKQVLLTVSDVTVSKALGTAFKLTTTRASSADWGNYDVAFTNVVVTTVASFTPNPSQDKGAFYVEKRESTARLNFTSISIGSTVGNAFHVGAGTAASTGNRYIFSNITVQSAAEKAFYLETTGSTTSVSLSNSTVTNSKGIHFFSNTGASTGGTILLNTVSASSMTPGFPGIFLEGATSSVTATNTVISNSSNTCLDIKGVLNSASYTFSQLTLSSCSNNSVRFTNAGLARGVTLSFTNVNATSSTSTGFYLEELDGNFNLNNGNLASFSYAGIHGAADFGRSVTSNIAVTNTVFGSGSSSQNTSVVESFGMYLHLGSQVGGSISVVNSTFTNLKYRAVVVKNAAMSIKLLSCSFNNVGSGVTYTSMVPTGVVDIRQSGDLNITSCSFINSSVASPALYISQSNSVLVFSNTFDTGVTAVFLQSYTTTAKILNNTIINYFPFGARSSFATPNPIADMAVLPIPPINTALTAIVYLKGGDMNNEQFQYNYFISCDKWRFLTFITGEQANITCNYWGSTRFWEFYMGITGPSKAKKINLTPFLNTPSLASSLGSIATQPFNSVNVNSPVTPTPATYLVNQDINIQNGGVLTLGPGVTFLLNDGVNIIVRNGGKLIINGTSRYVDSGFPGHDASLNSIATITNFLNGTQWGGIIFEPSAFGSVFTTTGVFIEGSLINNCLISGGGKGGANSFLQVQDVPLLIQDSLFYQSPNSMDSSIQLSDQSKMVYVKGSAFVNTGISLSYNETKSAMDKKSPLTIENCQGMNLFGVNTSDANLLSFRNYDSFAILVRVSRSFCQMAECISSSRLGLGSDVTIESTLFYASTVTVLGGESDTISASVSIITSSFQYFSEATAINVRDTHLIVRNNDFLNSATGTAIDYGSRKTDANGNSFNIQIIKCVFDGISVGIRLTSKFLAEIKTNTFTHGNMTSPIVILGGSQSLTSVIYRNLFIDANCDVCISVGETGLGAGTVNNKLSIWRNQFIRATGNSIIQFSKVGYAFGNIKANLFVNNTVFQPASSGIISLADSGVAVRGNIFNDAPIFKEIYLTSTNALYGKTDVSENFWYNRDIANVINNSTLVFLPASTITFENNVIPTVDPAFAAQMKDQSLVSFSVYDFPQNMDALKLRYLVFDDLTLDISQRYSTVGCTSKNTSMVECGAMPKYDSSFDVEDVILSYKSEFVFPIYPLFQDTTTVSLTSRYYRIPDLERATPSEILIHEVMRVNISANGYSTESESPFCQIKGSGKTYYVNGTLVLPSIVTCDFTPLDLSIGDYTISVSSFGNNSDFYSRNNVPFKVTSLIDTLVLQNDLSDSSLYTIAARASPTASLPTIASPFMIALVDVNGVVVDVSGVVVSVTISPAPASNAFIGTSAETVSGVASLRIGLYAQYGERYTLSFRTSVTGAKTVNFTYVSVANCSTYYTPDADRLSCTCAIGAYYSASGCTPCLIGYYKNTTGTGSCTKCDQGYTTESYGATSISECVCEAGAYLVNTTTGFQCKTCPVGGTCAGGSARPVSKDGYFHKGTTEAFAEEAFYKCGTGSYCLANNTCRTGTEGFLCARCQDGYYRNNYDCEECSSITHGGGIIAIITIVLVFLAVAALLMGLFLPNGSFKFAALGIGLNTVQILALYQYLDVNWPDFITNTYIRFSFFNFSIGLSSPECSFSLLKDSLLKWKVTLFIPPAFAILIFLCLLLLIFALFIFRKFGIIPMLQSPRYIFTNRQYFNAWKRVFIQFLVIVYTNMFSTTLNMVNCYTLEDGSTVLFAEKSVYCSSTEAKDLVPFIVFGVIVYVIGIPALLLYFLARNRHQLDRPSVIVSYGFLYDDYRIYYWEMIIMIRTFILVILLVLLKSYIQVQVFTVTFVLTVFIFLNMAVKPFHLRIHNRLEALSLTSMLVAMAAAFFYWDDTGFVIRTDGEILAMEVMIGLFLFAVIAIFGFCIFWEVIGILPSKVRKSIREPLLRFILPVRRYFKSTQQQIEKSSGTPSSIRPADPHFDPNAEPVDEDPQMPDIQLAAAKELGTVRDSRLFLSIPTSAQPASATDSSKTLSTPSNMSKAAEANIYASTNTLGENSTVWIPMEIRNSKEAEMNK